ncbi:MAG: hypothetical protein ABI992_03470 [Chthoniobacterales bacterium]
MKTFEESWIAWVDGELSGEELAEFKASLPDISVAEMEKQEAFKLGNLLRERIGVRAMANGEFFQHQLLQEIEREAASASPRPETKARESWWSIGRLVWTGAASLALLSVFTFFVMREKTVGGRSAYLTQIIDARVDPAVSPNANISIFESKENKVTVVWVNGLQSLPSEYAAK